MCIGVYSCWATAFIELGGPTDIWGRSWSPSEINSPNFGVRICSCEGERTRFVDAPAQTGYEELDLTDPNQTVTVATNLSGSGYFSVYLKVDAIDVDRGDLDKGFVITLVYTLMGGGGW